MTPLKVSCILNLIVFQIPKKNIINRLALFSSFHCNQVLYIHPSPKHMPHVLCPEVQIHTCDLISKKDHTITILATCCKHMFQYKLNLFLGTNEAISWPKISLSPHSSIMVNSSPSYRVKDN